MQQITRKIGSLNTESALIEQDMYYFIHKN